MHRQGAGGSARGMRRSGTTSSNRHRSLTGGHPADLGPPAPFPWACASCSGGGGVAAAATGAVAADQEQLPRVGSHTKGGSQRVEILLLQGGQGPSHHQRGTGSRPKSCSRPCPHWCVAGHCQPRCRRRCCSGRGLLPRQRPRRSAHRRPSEGRPPLSSAAMGPSGSPAWGTWLRSRGASEVRLENLPWAAGSCPAAAQAPSWLACVDGTSPVAACVV
mmetsp:Transcript_13747/g.40140  ORF Transcript_13747/g.40140 Transcript_13747/m.40140 type:complete len:218 (-) Transcript_13747:1863-2516(-)